MFKSLLLPTRVKAAGKARKCQHKKTHLLKKGDAVLEVRNGMAWSGYCAACAEEMIANALQGANDLRAEVKSISNSQTKHQSKP